MTKRNIVGIMPDTERYDLMSVVFIRLGGEIEEYEEKTLLHFLMNLFSDTLTFEENQTVLSEKYGIRMSEKDRKEVRDMCNYSEGIAEKYEAKGMAQGREEERRESIARLRAIGMTDEQLLSAGYTQEELCKPVMN